MLTEIELLAMETLLLHSKYSFSISGLAQKIQENYDRGSYASVRANIKSMEKENKVSTRKLGKTILVNLNYANISILVDSTIELESHKASMIIAEYPFFKEILNQLSEFFNKYSCSICCSYTRSNLRRNRIELTIIADHKMTKKDREEISTWITNIAILRNIRIDYFITTIRTFKEYLLTTDYNYIKEILYNRIVLVNSYNFWNMILPILSEQDDLKLKYDDNYLSETDFSEISNDVITYNLERFGYQEFGTTYKIEKKISIEYLIMAILFKDNQRWIESIKVLSSRNQDVLNVDLLVFLCRKYSLLGKLIETIKTL